MRGMDVSIKVASAVWAHSTHRLGTLLVLLYLADCAHDDGTSVYPSVSSMMANTRLSERGVQTALSALIKSGELERDGLGPHNVNRYRVRIDRLRGAKSAGVQSLRGAEPDVQEVQIPTETPAKIAPNPLENRKREPSIARMWQEGFALSEPMKLYATARGVNPATEFAAWHDDCLAHGRKYRDWEAAWRTRINNAPRFAPKNGTPVVVEMPRRKENYSDKVNRW